jgi:hypothetical protein
MKNKGLFIFNILFISIGVIAIISSIYASKPMNVNEVQYYGIELTDSRFKMTITGSNNPAYKFEKVEQTIINDTLFLIFYETMFNGDPYPYTLIIDGDFSSIKSIKLNDRNSIKEIYP